MVGDTGELGTAGAEVEQSRWVDRAAQFFEKLTRVEAPEAKGQIE